MKQQPKKQLLQNKEKKLLPLVGLFTREETDVPNLDVGVSKLHQTHRYPAPISHKPLDNIDFH